MKKWSLIIFLLLPVVAWAQIITTFAGTGSPSSGDGGTAIAAGITNPCGGTFDKYGNYYFAENAGHRIRKISPAGIIITIAGIGSPGFSGDNGLAIAAKINNPQAVILDSTGNLYIADLTNMRIRKVDVSTGIITTIAGSSLTPGYGGDNGPATAALLYGPTGLCFDKIGNLYFTDYQNYRIRKINTSGIITTVAGTGLPGNIGDNGPATAARISLLNALTIDTAGNFYLAGGNIVRKINPVGIISTFAGVYGTYIYTGDGVPATNAPMATANLAVDCYGQLIIADHMNRRVYRVDNGGILHHIAGNGMTGFSGDNGPSIAASLDFPSGVCFDSCGNLYVTEGNNNRIRKIAFNPHCWSLGVENTTPTYNVSIYPNPAKDVIHIDGVGSSSTYRLLSIMGAVVKVGVLVQGNNSISVQSLPAGVYVVEVVNDDDPPSPGNGYGGRRRMMTKVIKE